MDRSGETPGAGGGEGGGADVRGALFGETLCTGAGMPARSRMQVSPGRVPIGVRGERGCVRRARRRAGRCEGGRVGDDTLPVVGGPRGYGTR